MKRLHLTAALTFASLVLPSDAFAQRLGPQPPPQANGPLDPTTTSGCFNCNASSLLHWRKAVANVRTGTGRGRIAFLGDSTTAGAGAGTAGTNNYTGALLRNAVRSLATLLNTYSVPTNINTFFGSQAVQTSVTYTSYDPRVVLGANWTVAGTGILGGVAFLYSTGAINNLAFTPLAAFDTVSVYYLRTGTNGGFTYNVDGGSSLGTVATAGSQALLAATNTVTKATHTVNLVPLNDANFQIAGIYTFDSTTPAIDFFQFGQHGALISQFTSSAVPWGGIPALNTIAPDLTVVNLTINDSNVPTALATYTASMQTVLTQAKVTGDCLIMVGAPSNTTQATDGTLDSYVGALKGLAITNNCAMIDLKQRWTSYAVTNAVMPYFSSLHPSNLGYNDIGLAMYEVLSAP